MVHRVALCLIACFHAAGLLSATAIAGQAQEPVVVIVDMNPAMPGFQSDIEVPPGNRLVEGIGIYLYDPVGGRHLWAIGYLGGIDRGISFGHMPDPRNVGIVSQLIPRHGSPANPGNTHVFATAPGLDPGFSGPEVQYLEAGAAAPAQIATEPSAPIFTVDAQILGGREGDIFHFHLLDFVRVWAGSQHGSFSTRGFLSLDTGGDAIADSTRSIYGVDPDSVVLVPPAAYLVDYIDGGASPGPATIVVTAAAATNEDDTSRRNLLAPRPLAVEPNPFAGTTTIRVALRSGGPFRLGLYDVTGRAVRELLTGTDARGSHEVTWDGLDARGESLPAGVYFCKLEQGEGAILGRVALVR